MAGLQILPLCLLIVVLNFQNSWANHHLASGEDDYNKVMSYEVVGTGSHSSSITERNKNKQNTGIYAFRRQRRSPHIGTLGTHYYRPFYAQPVQPVAVAPAHGYYQGRPYNYQPHSQQLTNSHSQAQAISANFGGTHLLGTGGTGISAAAASAGSGTANQLAHHGYRRK